MRSAFAKGFAEALPLWMGVVPFALVYAAAGRTAGLAARDVQLMSLLVFAGGAQFTAVRLLAQGAPGVMLVAATGLINLRHVLYGLSLAPHLGRIRGWLRGLVAFLLVDESYGLAVRAYLAGRGSVPYVLGLGTSMYLAWNLGTAVGSASVALLPDPRRAGLDLVFPLTFVALLGPFLRRANNRRAALAAFLLGIVAVPSLPGGLGFVLATLVGVLVGVWGHD